MKETHQPQWLSWAMSYKEERKDTAVRRREDTSVQRRKKRHRCAVRRQTDLHEQRFMLFIVRGVRRRTLVFHVRHQTSVACDLTDALLQTTHKPTDMSHQTNAVIRTSNLYSSSLNMVSVTLCCLQRILGLTWADRVPHTTNLPSLRALAVSALNA